MILDGFLTFSLNQPLTAAGTVISTNIIDLGEVSGVPSSANGGGARDIGIGDDPAMKILVQVTTAFAGGTSIEPILAGAVDNGAGAPAAFTPWWQPVTPVPLASLGLGARLFDMDMPRPPAGVAVPRFLEMQYVVTGTFTAGTISAFIVLDRFDQMYNATANNVSGGYVPGIQIIN